ncbi:MAG: hypothetical protein WC870_03410 [Candidatus Paceibacterota bacterium]
MAESNTLNIAWQSQEKVPGLISGDDALMIYNSLPEQARVGLRYDESSKTIVGSTPFAVANLDVFAQKYGARTPNLKDLSRPEIMRIAKEKHYIDSRNLVVRSREDPNWSKNNSLLKTIYELAEQKEGSIKHPFMIEGFSFVPNSEDKNGYGFNLVANSDFKVVQDERFDGKYNGKSFSEVDELGIPKFYKNGSRTWFAKNKGLSGLYLDRGLDLDSSNYDLADSNGDGRVVFLK